MTHLHSKIAALNHQNCYLTSERAWIIKTWIGRIGCSKDIQSTVHNRWHSENIMLTQIWDMANHEANWKKMRETNIQSQNKNLLNSCQITINKIIGTINVRVEQTHSHVDTHKK